MRVFCLTVWKSHRACIFSKIAGAGWSITYVTLTKRFLYKISSYVYMQIFNRQHHPPEGILQCFLTALLSSLVLVKQNCNGEMWICTPVTVTFDMSTSQTDTTGVFRTVLIDIRGN